VAIGQMGRAVPDVFRALHRARSAGSSAMIGLAVSVVAVFNGLDSGQPGHGDCGRSKGD